ncbi:MAG: 30S ribosomal protein S2 [Candidatus Aureabacteria bacterium]|nr:30S ribosomal protein S2 [Candidatus Auribacterota bacterium]
MTAVTIKELMEAGVHFGHQTQKWNPKMQRYIFDKRNGIHIINLQKTVPLLMKACSFISELIVKGDIILFVGTKEQAKEMIIETATALSMPYVSERWLGGMLTNIVTIRQSIAKLENFEKMEADGTLAALSKKEQSVLMKEKAKLVKNLSGVKRMKALPDALFVVDPDHEHNAVAEARRLHIPIVAILDTNCDPDIIDYGIPANDDSLRAVSYILGAIKEAGMAGLDMWNKNEAEKKAREEKERAEESAKKEEKKRKSEEIRKVKEAAEQAEKARTEEIIADLESRQNLK